MGIWAEKLGLKTAELPLVWGMIEDGSKVKAVEDTIRAIRDLAVIRYRGVAWSVRKTTSKIGLVAANFTS